MSIPGDTVPITEPQPMDPDVKVVDLLQRLQQIPLINWCVLDVVHEDSYSADIITGSGQTYRNVPLPDSALADGASGAQVGGMPTEGTLGVCALIPSEHDLLYQPVILAFFMPARRLSKEETPEPKDVEDVGPHFTANQLRHEQGNVFRQLRERIKKGSWIARSTAGSKIVLHSSGDMQLLVDDRLQVAYLVKEKMWMWICGNIHGRYNGGFMKVKMRDGYVDTEMVFSDKSDFEQGNRFRFKVGKAAAILECAVEQPDGTDLFSLTVDESGNLTVHSKGNAQVTADGTAVVHSTGNMTISSDGIVSVQP